MSTSPASLKNSISYADELSYYRRARFSTAIIFFINGFIISSWVPHIPYVKESLSLSSFQLGVALLSISVGAIFSMYLTGMMIARNGTRLITIISAIFYVIVVVAPVLSTSYNMLLLSLIGVGVANGSLDVTMNTDGIECESKLGHPIMSSLHAMFSVGALTGAFLAVTSTSFGLEPSIHIISVAAVGLSLVVAYSQIRPKTWLGSKSVEKQFAIPRKSILLIASLTFIVLAAEGVITDWSGVYLVDVLNVDVGKSGIGFLAFSFSMATGRLLGDKIVSHIGRKRVLQIGSIVGVSSLFIVLISSNIFLVILGFSLVGFGLSNITPVLFSIAGESSKTSPSMAIAAVAASGYFGFLVAPPLVGYIADWKSLHHAFAVFMFSLLVVLVLSNRAVNTD